MAKQKQEQYLNELAASLGVFYIRLHQFHWYVDGPKFYTLHEVFENMYNEVTADLDEVSERMLQLNQKPVSTLAEYVEHSFIKEAPYTKMSADEMVKATLADYKVFKEKIHDGYDLFEGDEVTIDMLVGMNARVDKHIWMLEATAK